MSVRRAPSFASIVSLVFAACATAETVRAEYGFDASNFQGKHACAREVRMASPTTVRDVSEIAHAYARVKANGAGHSWHRGLFCAVGAEDEEEGVNVDTRGVRSATVGDERWWIDDGGGVVRCDAGVITRDLLNGLAARGYTLPAFPWFLDQTIGGACATASHGSSLHGNSLASQLVALTIVLADGSVKYYDEKTTNTALFNALRANLGRLGIVVDVTLRVVPNTLVTRRNENLSPDDFVADMQRVQDIVRACEKRHGKENVDNTWACAMKTDEIKALDEQQLFWYIPLEELTRVSYERSSPMPTFTAYDKRALSPELSQKHFGTLSASNVNALVKRQPRSAPRDVTAAVTLMGSENLARNWAQQWRRATAENILPETDEQSDSYLTMTERQYEMHDRFGYEQLEVGVPLRKAGTCARAFRDALYGDARLSGGFRSQALLRFIGPEQAWLAPTHGRAGTMYVNIEDFVKYSRVVDRMANEKFQKAVDVLRSSACDGRLHWGKFGFPKPGCFDGAAEYGVAFCHFGCQVHALDPNGKFRGDSDALTFAGIDFEKCCGADGLFRDGVDGCACALTDRAPASACADWSED
jgi:FAD/FMN-containing dehydrogenase